MEVNGELNLIQHSFVSKGNVLLSINHLIICFIESFIELGFLKCAYLLLIWCDNFIESRANSIILWRGSAQL